MARKSKSERMESRARWQAIRQIRDAKVRFNMANPESELLAPNVIHRVKNNVAPTYRKKSPGVGMDIGTALSTMKERFPRCRVSQLKTMTVGSGSGKIVSKVTFKKAEAAKRYKLNDLDLYQDKLDVSGGTKEHSLVRTGTRKGGKTGIYKPVGLPDSIPKDGGKTDKT